MIQNKTLSFPPYNPIGEEEAAAAAAVVHEGMLSDYLGAADVKFFGGKNVRAFESTWSDFHQVSHTVSFNSATSALIAAVGAIGIVPGDEVLVMPYSMCISATAPLFYGGIPVFVDIEPYTFCMDPAKIEEKITDKTRAILSVDLFGQSSDMAALRQIADKYDLKIITDASHVPGCPYNDGFAGTFGDIGVYSFNQHKIIHCGEGGAAVTNDDGLALRLQLIRNHGEAIVSDMKVKNLRNMVGGNTRFPEIEAAIMVEQLKKLPTLLRQRIDLADRLSEGFRKLDFLTPPTLRPGSGHVYYIYPLLFNEEAAGMDRTRFLENVKSLGAPVYRFTGGYIKPLYRLPVFSRKNEFQAGYPFNLADDSASVNYGDAGCPVVERLHNEEMIVLSCNYPPMTAADMDRIVGLYEKAALMK
ncbi:MAG: DegT/DnrJ/EryC1/StrS family aminotransferase [Rhodospirillaceae bacterium]|jgi:perosamine synthetase|nr:DegT/DnrJ/EryC1/StrS family aminotransferase [Rhodospirillaceae bacterium]MBT5242930.1 DegT/DnrJ/EryC1/StrS family aminotransferase [Rhodospirillaceae bacterium]MBT5563154.1 DegT/DnrJ/EryC1/StrS family aminotransferase [Rhodospirillaceae bacterium]MBT6243469.1 DegT/DnrJ/EryC1/StrS family aminotransferase [Rhodospirillaceae bacterium]MBT7138315.1 DegT/DnrJ/EryC1/StrS family aminotransferase [Rhodospirillaceae bacterium]